MNQPPADITPRMSTGVPTQTTLDVFMEADARRPGPALINVNNVVYFYPDENGACMVVFNSGESIGLNDTYAAVRTAILGV